MDNAVNKMICYVKNEDEQNVVINLTKERKSPLCSVAFFGVGWCFIDDCVILSLRKSLRKQHCRVLGNAHVDDCCDDHFSNCES